MPKIKICGLFREEDITFVNEAQPDYIGFVFAKSKRQVTEDTAKKLRSLLKNSIIPVGVFVNEPIENIISLFQNGIITIAQLHGGESEEYISKLKLLSGIKIIKSVQMDNHTDTAKLSETNADFLLLDNGAGGTGTAFDWTLIGNIKKPYFIAGGINTDNIDKAISLNPYAIDVSSGAETGGVKDFEKIKALVLKVR
ncbi:N-(5'-phosphoribosyl)anthranilate isomerase [Clostridia bacterium]|nr:N-(5'-phosphoribosyl)anthranilate isomerase [Clostridia bacterium]